MILAERNDNAKLEAAKSFIKERMAKKAKTGAKLNSGIKTGAQLIARIKKGDKTSFDYQVLVDTGKSYE